MKSIVKYTLVAGLAATLITTTTSCNESLLEIEQHGVESTDVYKKADDAQIKQFIASIYAAIRGDEVMNVMGGMIGKNKTNHALINMNLGQMADEAADGFSYQESSSSSAYSLIWSHYYTICYYCGMVIEYMPSNNVASPAVKDQAVAECRAIRAWAMMNLVQLYGSAPLANHILTGSEGNTPVADSWAWIEKEFSEAAQSLPTKSGKDGQKSIGGRLTREAAFAWLGKAQLWQGHYAEAAKTLHDQVIATGKYELLSEFDLINCASSDFSAENIWEFDFNENPENALSQTGAHECYLCPNINWSASTRFANTFMHYGAASCASKEIWDFFVNHDGKDSPRLKGSVQDIAMAVADGGEITYPYGGSQGYFKVKGIMRKEDETGNYYSSAFSKKNPVFMRYAEVLLNYAEAVCQGGQNGSSLSGLDALNQVRRRAGLADAPSLDMNNADYGIKAERRAELYLEGQRYIDLVRWGDATTTLAHVGQQTYQLLDGDQKADGTYNFSITPTGNPGWKTGKNELFPFPDSDVNNNPDLKQNPGW